MDGSREGMATRGGSTCQSRSLLRVLAVVAVAAECALESAASWGGRVAAGKEFAPTSQGGANNSTRADNLSSKSAHVPSLLFPSSSFEFTQAVGRDEVSAVPGAGNFEESLHTDASSQKLYRTHEGESTSLLHQSGEPYHASATGQYGGPSYGSHFGFPEAMRYYHRYHEPSPKAYNTQRAYAYEKVYPEQRYSTNHAISYEKHYNDDDNGSGRPKGGGYESRYSSSYPGTKGGYRSGYGDSSDHSDKGGSGYAHGPGYSGGRASRYDSRSAATSSERRDGAEPKIRRYVYKNPYDRSTTRVVEMHSGSGRPPPWAESSVSELVWKPGGMETFVAGPMRDG
ncbi:uncharacterized protein LOC144173828 [Haemaphysalis longicornis]